MEILGIGWQELIFIVILALIFLGPKDMQRAGRSIGRWLNQLVQSDSWKVFQRTSSELRNLPRTLMREANLEIREAEEEIRRAIDPRLEPPASRISSSRNWPPSKDMKKTVEPPAGRTDASASVPSRMPRTGPGSEAGTAQKGREGTDEAENSQAPDEHV